MRRWAFVCLLGACAVPPPGGAPSIATIEPSSGLTTEDTPVRINGANFHLSLVTDLDHDTTEIETATASIGTMPLDSVAWRGEGLVDATVPAGLPIGTYDVTVTVGTRTATLPGGFTVLAEPLPLGPFGTPTLVAELSSAAVDDDPSITADRLELFFNSDRTPALGGGDIFVTTRAAVSDPWGAPTNVMELSTASAETTPKISSDGLTIYFASDRLATGAMDLFVSTRASRTSPWSTPVPATELNSAARETGANMDPMQTSLVFQSDRGGNSDIYLATRATPADPWSTPVAMADVSSADYEADPCLTHQDRVMMFESTRPGSDGLDDLYMATRASSAVPFDPPVLMTELNSPSYEEDAFISDDLRYILFSSYRSGNWEIYEASR